MDHHNLPTPDQVQEVLNMIPKPPELTDHQWLLVKRGPLAERFLQVLAGIPESNSPPNPALTSLQQASINRLERYFRALREILAGPPANPMFGYQHHQWTALEHEAFVFFFTPACIDFAGLRYEFVRNLMEENARLQEARAPGARMGLPPANRATVAGGHCVLDTPRVAPGVQISNWGIRGTQGHFAPAPLAVRAQMDPEMMEEENSSPRPRTSEGSDSSSETSLAASDDSEDEEIDVVGGIEEVEPVGNAQKSGVPAPAPVPVHFMQVKGIPTGLAPILTMKDLTEEDEDGPRNEKNVGSGLIDLELDIPNDPQFPKAHITPMTGDVNGALLMVQQLMATAGHGYGHKGWAMGQDGSTPGYQDVPNNMNATDAYGFDGMELYSGSPARKSSTPDSQEDDDYLAYDDVADDGHDSSVRGLPVSPANEETDERSQPSSPVQQTLVNQGPSTSARTLGAPAGPIRGKISSNSNRDRSRFTDSRSKSNAWAYNRAQSIPLVVKGYDGFKERETALRAHLPEAGIYKNVDFKGIEDLLHQQLFEPTEDLQELPQMKERRNLNSRTLYLRWRKHNPKPEGDFDNASDQWKEWKRSKAPELERWQRLCNLVNDEKLKQLALGFITVPPKEIVALSRIRKRGRGGSAPGSDGGPAARSGSPAQGRRGEVVATAESPRKRRRPARVAATTAHPIGAAGLADLASSPSGSQANESVSNPHGQGCGDRQAAHGDDEDEI